MKEVDPYQSLILDCDFCDNAEHFTDIPAAVEAGWNWMSSEYKDGTELVTVACPDCDHDRVSDHHDAKMELITYSESPKPAQGARRDLGQTSLASKEKSGENQ